METSAKEPPPWFQHGTWKYLMLKCFFYTGINIYFNKHVLQKIVRNKYN